MGTAVLLLVNLAKSLPFKGAGYFQAWKNYGFFLKICQISPFGLTWFTRKPIKNKDMLSSYGPCIWYECARCLLLRIRVYHFWPWSRRRHLFILSFLLLLSLDHECALRGVAFNVNDLLLWFAKVPYTLEHIELPSMSMIFSFDLLKFLTHLNI
jgi:hypothetical protein